MLSKVQAALAKMLEPGEPLLAGVSGGADLSRFSTRS